MSQEVKKNQRELVGVVVGNKMSKTIVVKVDRQIIHPKYKKQYIQSHKYKVHDEKQEAKVGSKVLFSACRPLSADKRWRLIKILK